MDFYIKNKNNQMLKTSKKKITLFLVTILLFLNPLVASAENDCNPCEGADEGVVCIPNPLQFCSINEFLTALTNLLIQLGLALVVFMVMLGGAFYMFGGANPQNIEKGKNIIKWTVLGLFVVLLARAILALIHFVIGI